MKIAISLFIVAFFLFSGAAHALPLSDLAGLLEESDKTTLISKLDDISSSQGFKIVLITGVPVDGSSASEWFFGSSLEREGTPNMNVLLMYDQDKNVLGVGIAENSAWTNAELEQIANTTIRENIDSGDYFPAFSQLIENFKSAAPAKMETKEICEPVTNVYAVAGVEGEIPNSVGIIADAFEPVYVYGVAKDSCGNYFGQGLTMAVIEGDTFAVSQNSFDFEWHDYYGYVKETPQGENYIGPYIGPVELNTGYENPDAGTERIYLKYTPSYLSSNQVRVSIKGDVKISDLMPACTDCSAADVENFMDTIQIWQGVPVSIGSSSEQCADITNADCADLAITTAWLTGLLPGYDKPPCSNWGATSLASMQAPTEPRTDWEYEYGFGSLESSAILPIVDVTFDGNNFWILESVPAPAMSKVTKIDTEGKTEFSRIFEGSDFRRIVIDGNNVYVANWAPHEANAADSVVVLGYAGDYIKMIHMKGPNDFFEQPATNDFDSDPYGIAISGTDIYILTQDWDTVLRFDKTTLEPKKWKDKDTNRIYIGPKGESDYVPDPKRGTDCDSKCSSFNKDITYLNGKLYVMYMDGLRTFLKIYDAETGSLLNSNYFSGESFKIWTDGENVLMSRTGDVAVFDADGNFKISKYKDEWLFYDLVYRFGDYTVLVKKPSSIKITNEKTGENIYSRTGDIKILKKKGSEVFGEAEIKIGLGEGEVRPGDMIIWGTVDQGIHTQMFFKDNGNGLLDSDDMVVEYGLKYKNLAYPTSFLIRKWNNYA